MHFPTNTIGPIIASYITHRPSELEPCPANILGKHCDGDGLFTLCVGTFKAKRCDCFPRYCLDMPLARWKTAAWNIILVLQQREESAKRRVVDQRLQSNELKDKMPSMGEAAVADGTELQEIGGVGGKGHSASGGNGQPIYMPPKRQFAFAAASVASDKSFLQQHLAHDKSLSSNLSSSSSTTQQFPRSS